MKLKLRSNGLRSVNESVNLFNWTDTLPKRKKNIIQSILKIRWKENYTKNVNSLNKVKTSFKVMKNKHHRLTNHIRNISLMKVKVSLLGLRNIRSLMTVMDIIYQIKIIHYSQEQWQKMRC